MKLKTSVIEITVRKIRPTVYEDRHGRNERMRAIVEGKREKK